MFGQPAGNEQSGLDAAVFDDGRPGVGPGPLAIAKRGLDLRPKSLAIDDQLFELTTHSPPPDAKLFAICRSHELDTPSDPCFGE